MPGFPDFMITVKMNMNKFNFVNKREARN